MLTSQNNMVGYLCHLSNKLVDKIIKILNSLYFDAEKLFEKKLGILRKNIRKKLLQFF